MKKNIKAAKFFICLGIIGLVAACSSDVQSYGNSIKVVNVSAKELLAPDYGEQDSAAVKAATGANDFAFRLSAELVKTAGNGNFVCSPYSAWMPLAALANATDAQNKAALLTALGASGITETDINRASSRMLYSLTNGNYNPLKIANAIFVGKNVTLKQDFAQTFMDYYRGSSINVDFSSHEAVDAVNRWASNNTNGLIKNVIQEFDPLTVAAIANAIYFSDRWSWEFNSGQTKEEVFHAPGLDTTALFMLRQGDGQTYYEDPKVQAMPLRFENGGGLYIILPKTGTAAQLLSSMTNSYFNEIQRGSVPATGKLLLPRFSIESTIDDLKEALVALGVPLFNKEAAPLTGGLIEEPFLVWLSKATQKAAIKVDEKGTTAAAVTVMEVGATSAGPPEPSKPFEMICNKPFVFILYDYTYDGGSQILFTGIVNQP
jgi:serine protease inhibitor